NVLQGSPNLSRASLICAKLLSMISCFSISSSTRKMSSRSEMSVVLADEPFPVSCFNHKRRLTAYKKVLSLLLSSKFPRSEEHTSELQSRENLVCRLLLEKKKTQHIH